MALPRVTVRYWGNSTSIMSSVFSPCINIPCSSCCFTILIAATVSLAFTSWGRAKWCQPPQSMSALIIDVSVLKPANDGRQTSSIPSCCFDPSLITKPCPLGPHHTRTNVVHSGTDSREPDTCSHKRGTRKPKIIFSFANPHQIRTPFNIIILSAHTCRAKQPLMWP